ncbi:autophagy-related protein 13 [Podospora fimiseda]|uniref:Autophagy-related protein 13 n=1 Tax=Podospora fimiseda TaxID=252190 RepID=A0AAN7BV35_9PEZI|nr:autophagy-related protein 13 [Podospora fimiseda]
MHQQSRHPPRVSSPASSPQTNPTRTNNPRDRGRSSSITSGQDVVSGSESPGGAGAAGRSPASPESIKKLDQIIKNLFAKAAVIVLQSRINLTQSAGKKSNTWFSIETAEIDDFREELRVYKSVGCFEVRPPPLIIETYIDASNLNNGQSLVVVDENGKRWDVLEALNLEDAEDDSPRRRQPQARNTQVVLERWRIELQCLPGLNLDQDFGLSLPTVYKKAIVFFRAFYAMTRLFPCWKSSQHALTKAAHPALEVKCRVLSSEPEYPTFDPLRQPLYHGDRREVATEFSASVSYRTEVNFRVDDSESLLSSRFMGVDENFFKPSIPRREARHGRSDSYAEPGSLPSRHRQGRGAPQDAQQTYGSLSTFHGDGAMGTSPITALRQLRPIGSDTSSPSESPSASSDRPDPPHSLPIRSSAGMRPSLRTSGESSRRTSISFQPFKAGSLSGSPKLPEMEVPPSPQSSTRPSSLQAGMAASLRGPSAPSTQDVPILSASPKPGSRYSSSFSHRRSRPSFGGQSRNADDDQASSGKQSLSSSAQPGSGLLTDLYSGGAASSSSFQTDDDNISEFLKALDTHKTLKSFEPGKKGEPSAASRRTAAQLSKFQMMRESHAALSDSMTSSIQLRSVTGSSPSTSRQLMGPSLVGPSSAISMSTSTSPGTGMASGKPLSSPHTPHTPAIPSRLSENSIIDYQQPATGRHRHSGIDPTEEEGEVDDGETPIATGQEGRGTGAIDIPLSPRLFHHDGRRTVASVALGGQRQSLQSVEGGVSISAPTSGASPTKRGDDDDIPPASLTTGIARGGSSRYLNRGGGSGSRSRPGSFSSINRGGGFGTSLDAGAGVDEEPLLFAMSELEREGRRSLDVPGGEGNKATDENLTSEDWAAIMEVCDRVASDSNGSKEAVQSMIKRLAHRNANVQLYTLEVANALSQNCGKNMHRELSSRAFTDALLKLANDRNTHNQVKAKILERMKDWSDMFKSDPDLGIMYDAYFRLKQTNPTLHPPSAPQKNSLTEQDHLKEEEELQMALKLSLQEEERKKKPAQAASVPGPSSSSGAGAGSSGAAAQQAAAPVQQQVPSGTTAATVSRVRALYDFVPSEPGELEFKKGDVIAVLESVYKDWWRGSLKGKTGIFPLNYVEKLTDPTPDELQREAQMEAEVFAEIKNVEKLLTLLSASNTAPREEDNEEISKLYHQTLAIRPKLIKLIEKYSQKKDDFTQLNEKFIKARRDYEALLESSMSHPPGPNYHQYAMRPQIPQGYPPQQGGYGGPSQPQDPQRFYTPAPTQEPSQYPPQSPSPNYHRPGQSVGGGGAPVYFAGAEVPPQANQPPTQTQQQPPAQQQGPPQPQQQPPQQPPSQQGYAPRPQDQRIPSGGKQPAPIQTSTSPPPQNQYVPYSQNPTAGGAPVRPQSTYGSGPQELSTSVYDSPIASHHNPSGYYTTTANPSAPEDPYSASTPSAPSAPPPAIPGEHQRQPSYGQYNAYQAAAAGRPLSPPPLQPSGNAVDTGGAYVPPSGGGADEGDSYYRGGGY